MAQLGGIGERASNSPSMAAAAALTIRIDGFERLYHCVAGRSVLQALVRGPDRVIGAGCFAGGCGVCRIRIIDGRYRTTKLSRAHVSIEDEAKGVTLACRTWSLTDLVIVPLGKCVIRATASLNPPVVTPRHLPDDILEIRS